MDHLEREDPPILIVEGFYPVSWEIPQADKPPPMCIELFISSYMKNQWGIVRCSREASVRKRQESKKEPSRNRGHRKQKTLKKFSLTLEIRWCFHYTRRGIIQQSFEKPKKKEVFEVNDGQNNSFNKLQDKMRKAEKRNVEGHLVRLIIQLTGVL